MGLDSWVTRRRNGGVALLAADAKRSGEYGSERGRLARHLLVCGLLPEAASMLYTAGLFFYSFGGASVCLELRLALAALRCVDNISGKRLPKEALRSISISSVLTLGAESL